MQQDNLPPLPEMRPIPAVAHEPAERYLPPVRPNNPPALPLGRLPRGYRYSKDKAKGSGAIIERHEPVATIIQNALEAFACGHLETQADVARFLHADPRFPRDQHGRVPDQAAKNILTNPLYAGYVEVPRWNVSLRPGHHPSLISFETFQTIQRRLSGNAKRLVRTDNSQDFALRGHVVCDCCGTRLTSCWAKGVARPISVLSLPGEKLRGLWPVDPARQDQGRVR